MSTSSFLYLQHSASPSVLQPDDYTVGLTSQTYFAISFSSTFSALHNVTSYNVNVTGSSTNCASLCPPNNPCQCTTPAVREPVSINISATNCGDQEGPATVLQAETRLPSQPLGCSSVSVYNYTSDLIGIKLQWMRVDVS